MPLPVVTTTSTVAEEWVARNGEDLCVSREWCRRSRHTSKGHRGRPSVALSRDGDAGPAPCEPEPLFGLTELTTGVDSSTSRR